MIITYDENAKTLIINDCFKDVDSKMLYDECMDILMAYLELWINAENKDTVCLNEVVDYCISPYIYIQEKLIYEYGITEAVKLHNDTYGLEYLDMNNISGNLCFCILNTLMSDEISDLDKYNEYDIKKIELHYRGLNIETIYHNDYDD